MISNPEFLRNVWLELTPHRLLGMPAVLLAIFFLTYLITGDNFVGSARIIAMILYFGFTIFWGTRLAGEALLSEVQDRTWDQQRMSSISPWSMAWGKLFGSTIYPWYGAAICLLVYAATSVQSHQYDTFKYLLFMLAIAVLSQGVALLSSIQTVKIYQRSASTAFMVLGIIAALPVISVAYRETGFLTWYTIQVRILDFILLSVVLFAGWSLVGIYRKMGEELQFRNTPVYWFVFCAFMAIYLAGFVTGNLPGDSLETLRLLVAYSTYIILAYTMLILEEKNPSILRRMMVASAQRNWRAVFESTPCWLLTLLCVYVLCVVLMFNHYPDIAFAGRGFSFKPYLLAMAFFLTRDTFIFIFFSMSANRRRADMTAVFYLLLLYWLLPSILAGLNFPLAQATLLPVGTNNATVSIISALVQCVVLGFLIVQRWKRLYK